jgi:pilus assembly protein CpaB
VAPIAVPAKTTEVLVATNTIAAGTRLRPAMFRLETKISDNNLSERVLLNLNEIEGAYARVSIGVGSPLLKESISPLSTTADITERIPPGYRAVAIPVNLVTGVEGWVQPGARVDVTWNAQVLSAERRLEARPGGSMDDNAAPVPSHVTLLVTTKDSQRLQLAKNSGSLSLSLRGDKDVDPGNAATLSTDSIIKNRNQQGPADVQGKVTFGGQEYILSGSELMPESKYQARAKMKEPSDF